MNPSQVWHEISSFGTIHEFIIETARGLFAGMVQSPSALSHEYHDVNVWHPVPRWMNPHEVLNALP